jgi:hypothetical protein
MRLWSLHPSHLDAQGLVALWREALLAQKVLKGKTVGYRHHPQLRRFQDSIDPVASIGAYLRAIHEEARRRSYTFDASKIECDRRCGRLEVTQAQLVFESEHLKQKLRRRDPERFRTFRRMRKVKVHPLFVVVPGEIEPWEKRRERPRSISSLRRRH